MNEELTLKLDKRREINENFDSFAEKMFLIFECFKINADISFELAKTLLLICGINEDDIILKLFIPINNMPINNNEHGFYIKTIKDLSIESIKILYNKDIYFLLYHGFNVDIIYSGKYNLKLNDVSINNVDVPFLYILKNKTTIIFNITCIFLYSGSVAIGMNAIYNTTTGTHNVAIGRNAIFDMPGTCNTYVAFARDPILQGTNNVAPDNTALNIAGTHNISTSHNG